MTELQEIVSSLLANEGAMVEPIEPDGIEVLAPAPLQRRLSVPEWFRLGFGTDTPAEAQRVTLESDWMDRFSGLLEDRGRFLEITVERDAGVRFPADVEPLVARQMALDNATYRIVKTGEARARYLLLSLRLVAVSDEKREDIVHLCVNESTCAPADSLAAPLRGILAGGRECAGAAAREDEGPKPWGSAEAVAYARRVLPARIRSLLKPFLAGMERRMKRDMERIHAYHTDLYREAARRLAVKAEKARDAEAGERERQRLAAIEREYHAKATDLSRKYAISVNVELIQTLRASVPVLRAELLLLRRKASRPYALDWNPLSRRLDDVACEACGGLSPAYAACDEHVHLTCAACHAPCPACGKPWCRVCSPRQCARCGGHPA